MEPTELFRRLRELISIRQDEDTCIEVLVDKDFKVGRMRSFAAMSGCGLTCEKKDGCLILVVKGGSCGCG